MRSGAARLSLGAMAWLAVAAAASFLIHTERQLAGGTTALRAFDLHARETTDALADLRVAQQAYVAAGQGAAFWMPKVASTIDRVKSNVVSLRQSAASAAARASLMEAEAAIADFESVDKRARDYLKSGDQLMAADVIFTEGGENAAAAVRQVEAARLAEHQTFDANAAMQRKMEAIVLGAAAAFVGIIVLALIPLRRAQAAENADDPSTAPLSIPESQPSPVSVRTAATLRATADVCTDFARIRDVDDLKHLLARAAETMDATGLVVWLGSPSGADLRPVVAHGYAPNIVARMPTVPRSADNAAAAAYRTGSLQIVLSRPGQSSGAIVAPLLAADGCIGALSAEIRGGSEGSESVQALIAIFAAHLASVFAVTAADSAAAEPKAAAQG